VAQPSAPQPSKRVVVYMPETQHRLLKSKLARLGLTVSEWLRKEVDQFLEDETT